MSFNRIKNSNIQDKVQAKITDVVADSRDLQQRIFYFGQVINNIDPGNLNRIQIRIPIIDDNFYLESKDAGDKNLPWASSTSVRFIDTPEVNAIVLVAVFDIKTPYFGRIYFNSITDISSIELFNKLTPEEKILSNLALVQDIYHIKLNSIPLNNHEFEGTPNINYNVGIRGKGGNSVLLSETSIQLKQKTNNTNSSLTIDEDTVINTAENILLLSQKGGSNLYHPVFEIPTYDYFSSLNNIIKKIIQVLATNPAISPIGPCIASPTGEMLLEDFVELLEKYNNYTQIGHSKNTIIN